MYPRGRGGWSLRGRGAHRPNFSPPGVSRTVDVRNKLIESRRTVGDARSVIRQHVVEKVGDLRAMLKPKRGFLSHKRGGFLPIRGFGQRGRGDLRSGINHIRHTNNGVSRNLKPKLVYAEDLQAKASRRQNPRSQDSGVTVGRGGNVTISRRRGMSIDNEEEVVQPTGIPAHMRRQPSPPPLRPVNRTPSPAPPSRHPAQPIYNRSEQQQPPYERQRQRIPSPEYSHRSYSPPARRPQSYIVSPVKRGGASGAPAEYGDWVAPRMGRLYDYRHRSRSPLHANDRQHSPSHYRNGRSSFRSNSPDDYGRPAMPLDCWQRSRSRSPVDYRHKPVRRSLTPPNRMVETRDHRHGHPYAAAAHASVNKSSLRMDRIPSNSGNSYKPTTFYKEKSAEVVEKHRQPPPMRNSLSQQQAAPQISYTVRVTSLSPEVSEDDVVELFSDIGPLISAKLISKGHAEVSFVMKKDAKTAIEKYDRRELDGIPMNLKLIEKALPLTRPNKH